MSKAVRVRVAGIFTRGDEILLVNHVRGPESYWLLPGGGVDFGETMAQALERELMEECAVKVRAGRLLFIAESLPPDRHRHIVNITLLGEALEGEARLNESGGRLRGVAWKKKQELPGLPFFPDFKDEILRQWDSGFTLPPRSLGNLWAD
ncbi:MAG TPA: NUDIX domain-containing protein [bacterium]|jgi:8-oxo-dGTP diphosphatase|nr:NUDIX domain-containing protein [bacterium]